MRSLSLIFPVILVFAAACGPDASPPAGAAPGMQNPYAPMPADAAQVRSPVFLSSSRILVLESYPLQFAVALEGDLPTPCHALRALVSGPDARNRITIDLYSLADPGVVCAQVLMPFSANIHLGSFPHGHYSVWINGRQAGEFDS